MCFCEFLKDVRRDHLLPLPFKGMLMEVLGDEGSARLLPMEVGLCIVGGRQPAEVRRFGKWDWARHGGAFFKSGMVSVFEGINTSEFCRFMSWGGGAERLPPIANSRTRQLFGKKQTNMESKKAKEGSLNNSPNQTSLLSIKSVVLVQIY